MRGLNCCGCGRNQPYLTAYEIAVKHGFRGTEAEWVESLYHGRIVRVTSRTGDSFTCDQTLETIRDWSRENLVEMALDDGRTARLSEVGATAVFATEWFETDDGQAYETWVVGEGVNIVQRHVIEWSEETREMTWEDIKPAGGIPSTDLDGNVQESLLKADKAYRKPDSGIGQNDLHESLRDAFFKAAGIGLAQSMTQDRVEKTAGNTDYFTLRPNVIVAVFFYTPVDAYATLNINNTGARPIYHNNVPIRDGIIGWRNTATFVYDGSKYHLLALDTALAPTNYGEENEGMLLAVGPDGKPAVSNSTFYVKPNGGIPASDLSSDLREDISRGVTIYIPVFESGGGYVIDPTDMNLHGYESKEAAIAAGANVKLYVNHENSTSIVPFTSIPTQNVFIFSGPESSNTEGSVIAFYTVTANSLDVARTVYSLS